MDQNISDSYQRESKQCLEREDIKMVTLTMGNGKSISRTAGEFISINLMDINTKGTGRMTRDMDTVDRSP